MDARLMHRRGPPARCRRRNCPWSSTSTRFFMRLTRPRSWLATTRWCRVRAAGEQRHDFRGQGGIEVAGRLVREQQLRLADHRARDAHALLFASGKLRRQRAFALAHPGARGCCARACRSRAGACRAGSAATRCSRTRCGRAAGDGPGTPRRRRAGAAPPGRRAPVQVALAEHHHATARLFGEVDEKRAGCSCPRRNGR